MFVQSYESTKKSTQYKLLKTTKLHFIYMVIILFSRRFFLCNWFCLNRDLRGKCCVVLAPPLSKNFLQPAHFGGPGPRNIRYSVPWVMIQVKHPLNHAVSTVLHCTAVHYFDFNFVLDRFSEARHNFSIPLLMVLLFSSLKNRQLESSDLMGSSKTTK